MSDRAWLDAAIMGYPTATVARVAGSVAVFALVLLIVHMIRGRRNRRANSIDLDSPASILEEMRKRLEELPTLPQFATQRHGDLDLPNPFGEPTPPPTSITVPSPEPLPKRLSQPPLPTDAEDPITGEPDEAVYRAWLKEWLVYAEQYGDDPDDDPSHLEQTGDDLVQ